MPKYIDLTQPFFNGMLYNWYIPEVPKPHILTIRKGEPGNDRLGFQEILTSTHIGTHIDAQKHWDFSKKAIDEYPIERFISTAVCIDFSSVSPMSEISLDLFKEEKERMGGDILHGDVVLFYTGYGKFFESNYHKYYEQPYLSTELAKYLVKQEISIVGIDGHTVDKPYSLRSVTFVPGIEREKSFMSPDGPNQDSVHDILLQSDILIIEHMANLNMVANRRFNLIVAPIKLRGGDGAPVRCIGVLDE